MRRRGNQIATTAHTRNEATGTAYRGRRRRTALSAHTRAVATAAAGKKMAARWRIRDQTPHCKPQPRRDGQEQWPRPTAPDRWSCLGPTPACISVENNAQSSSNTSSSGPCPGGPSAPSSSSSQALFARPGTCLIPLGSQGANRVPDVPSRPGPGWGQLCWDAAQPWRTPVCYAVLRSTPSEG